MKTLSIRQPWAELILQGRKTIELRTWRTNYRGPLLIHAGGNVEYDACAAYGLDPEVLVRGALVGTVEVVDMVTFNHASFAALRNEHLDPGEWPGDLVGWRLANPCRLPAPIPLRGRLGLFEIPDEVLAGNAPVPHYLTPRQPAGPPSPRPLPPPPAGPPPHGYDPTRPFELHVEPRDAHGYALTLYQWPVKANGVPAEARRIVTLSGVNLLAVVDHVLEALRRTGYRTTDLSSRRHKPFRLDEETGLRLGLLFLTIAPLSRLDRIEAISRELRAMPSEEAYYWYSKCTDPRASGRAQQALRTLLAAE
ncbi:MAG: ASCH domain-containing protein [Anaerolineae bacterium]|nr:ASCH domain-containing protein [Anaerolineae bacterium]